MAADAAVRRSAWPKPAKKSLEKDRLAQLLQVQQSEPIRSAWP
jgi:hypothetical protein